MKKEADENKARYTATPVACGWAGAVKEKFTGVFMQVGLAQKAQKSQKKEGDRPTNSAMDGQT